MGGHQAGGTGSGRSPPSGHLLHIVPPCADFFSLHDLEVVIQKGLYGSGVGLGSSKAASRVGMLLALVVLVSSGSSR